MYPELIKLYQNKIIEISKDNPSYDPYKYYYFYKDQEIIFGIEKSISYNEYSLIKSFYIEKTFHFNNQSSQKIHEYLFEQGPYPFTNPITRFLIYSTTNQNEQINSLLNDLYDNIEVFEYQDLIIVFYFTHFEDQIKGLFETLSDDLGITINVHLGFIFDDTFTGNILKDYLMIYKGSINQSKILNQSSDLFDLVFEVNKNYQDQLYSLLYKKIISPIYLNYQEIIDSLFKNELNISQTAKALYMHRNSLINKLELISKQLGFSIQQFKVACGIWVIKSIK